MKIPNGIEGKINIFWFRRDLRLEDNRGLSEALSAGLPVLTVFIFDSDIIDGLPIDDARVTFIHDRLSFLNDELMGLGSALLICKGRVYDAFKRLSGELKINGVFANEDHEPAALRRDRDLHCQLDAEGITLHLFRDHVVFSPGEILKNDGTPYTVFTPFYNKWKKLLPLNEDRLLGMTLSRENFLKFSMSFPELEDLGFSRSGISVDPIRYENFPRYDAVREDLSERGGTGLGPHLRFGTVSSRTLIERAMDESESLLAELVWREFFIHILYHFPHSENQNFRSKYDGVKWRESAKDLHKWKEGMTGFPLVDAGMRQLNTQGKMPGRVRMVCASFLTKNLLIYWKYGEEYFAEKLIDFELANNVGNWQWAAGTGCDAQPYFRIFNPHTQLKRFDPRQSYVKRWIAEYGTDRYPGEMLQHAEARERALKAFKETLGR